MNFMSYVNLPIILSSEPDSDNDLFNEDEVDEDADDEQVEEEEPDADEEDSLQDNEGNADTNVNSDASSDILEHEDGATNVTTENPTGGAEESGPAVHHAESDEVEIFRVDRRTVRNATAEDEFDESTDDFQTPRKRRRVKIDDDEEEKEPKKSEPSVDLNETFDSESCPICFESWTNSGDHRLASLKCGHLFGFGCIDKWLMGPGRSCPQCNAGAKRKDIRVIYAKKLSMADTAEADRLRLELGKERTLRLQAEAEAVNYRIQAQFMGDECARLKLKIERLQEKLSSGFVDQLMGGNSVAGGSGDNVSGIPGGCYVFQKLLRLSEGACRVMAPCNYMKLLCIAQASPNPLFRGFGIKKIHLVDHHMDRFLVLHSQMIRDLALHPDMTDGLLLSVSMDKTAKLVSLFTSQVVQTYSCPLPVWSCTWHRDNHHQFFAGLANGQVLQFDTRKTNSSLNCFTNPSVTPVCSLQYAPRDSTSSSGTFRQGGLFVGQLDRLTFFEELLSDSAPPGSQVSTLHGGFRSHPLPLDGSLVSLSFEAQTRHLMATFRPSRTQASLATVRHLVCQIESRSSSGEADADSQSSVCSCNLVHALTGGRQMQRMVRSRLYRGPGERLLAASGDEEAVGTIVWDAAQGESLQMLKGPNNGGAVVDLAPFDVGADSGDGHGLVTLTESAVQFFRWRDTT